MRSLSAVVCCGALAAALVSCVQKQERPAPAAPGGERRLLPPELAQRRAMPAVPPDSVLTLIAPSSSYLPRWKTELEQELERRASGAGGLAAADQYDDYRNLNIDKFSITKPPTTAGIRPPAEYEPSQAYLLHWASYSQTAWKALFGSIVKGAWGVVPVLMIYKDASHKAWIEGELASLGYSQSEMQDPKNIIWWEHATNAIWARDYGPVSIADSPTSGSPTLSFVDFRYYHARQHDDEIPADLAKDWGVNDFRPDLDYEGGNFMSTSDGLCAATKGVLYYNLQYSQSAVEQIFSDYLGCQASLFTATMKGGVIAHIDMYAKFASDTEMLVGEYQASQDATNKAILDGVAQLFASTQTPSGKTMQVTRIPMPNHTGALPTLNTWRTYTNSLSLVGPSGKVVLIPVYSDETTYETAALAAYAKVYPGWTLVPIDSKVIIPGQGAIHCITMQIPAGTKAKMETDPLDLCGSTEFECVKEVCGNVPAEGCCEEGILKYCSKSSLKYIDCDSNPQCGWDSAKSLYNCGTAGSADPAGAFPLSCAVVKDAGGPEGGYPDQWVDPCGDIPYQGCCEGETVKFCQSGQLKTLDCSQNPSCGWSASLGGYECGTSGGTDPTGKFPRACPGFAPDGGPDSGGADTGVPDSRPLLDSRPATDGADGGTSGDGGDDGGGGGCGCSLAGKPRPLPALPLLGLLLLGAALIRRR